LAEQPFNLRGLFHLARHHRVLVVAFLLLGSAVAAGYLVIRPPLYKAESLVLLPSSSGSQSSSTTNLSTDGQIATSAAVLGAISHQHPSLPVSLLRQRVTTGSTAANILQITATAPSAIGAQNIANYVADGFVKYVTTYGNSASAGLLSGLTAEAQSLNSQIKSLDSQITDTSNRISAEGASSPSGQQDTALLGTLISDRSQAVLQLDSVNNQIAQSRRGAKSGSDGTVVIQHATAASHASFLWEAAIILVGTLGGLLVGLLVLSLVHRDDRHLYLRDDIAEATGAPVLLSLSSPRTTSPHQWVHLFTRAQPSPADQWNTRRMLRQLDPDDRPGTIVVLTFSDDGRGCTAGPQIAVLAASQGIPARLSVSRGPRDANVVELRRAIKRITVLGDDLPQNLSLDADGDPSPADRLTIHFCSVERAAPHLLSPNSQATVLLAVSAGSSTAVDLARLALTASDAGMPIRGVILISPDPGDQTTGIATGGQPTASTTRPRAIQALQGTRQ
jgi:capsular polysaccharide biosynthesis protein